MKHWQQLARTLERGLFDGIFLADVTGVYDVYGGSPSAALRAAAQVPANDPFLIVPVMAAVTEHLGAPPVIVGSPESVADELQRLVEATDLDGFNLAYTVLPECFEEFVDLVVPELQRRGAYKTSYADGTMRQKLFGSGDRLPASHPAASFRRA